MRSSKLEAEPPRALCTMWTIDSTIIDIADAAWEPEPGALAWKLDRWSR